MLIGFQGCRGAWWRQGWVRSRACVRITHRESLINGMPDESKERPFCTKHRNVQGKNSLVALLCTLLGAQRILRGLCVGKAEEEGSAQPTPMDVQDISEVVDILRSRTPVF